MFCLYKDNTKLELSIPPERNIPSGTSEINLYLTEKSIFFLTFSLASSNVPLNLFFLAFIKLFILFQYSFFVI